MSGNDHQGHQFNDPDLKRWSAIDAEVVAVGRRVKVLSSLAWPTTAQEEFLASVRRGEPRLPVVPTLQVDLSEVREQGADIIARLPGDHPLEEYLRDTMTSYVIAARMLESAGTPAFVELGSRIYGTPNQRLAEGASSVLDVAEHFLVATDELAPICRHTDQDFCVLPETVVAGLRTRATAVFGARAIRVVADPTLASKAAAGADGVRVRSLTCFSREDVPQLIEHELLVHTLTAVNGREQPHFGSFGLGAPRTTMTQEGLAVLAEVATGAMDLNRLRRLALRPKGVPLALDGADFIEVYRFFVDAGQDEVESYQSTYRLFRGGDVRGRVAFVKDGVYLLGLLTVHSFLRKAMEERQVDLLHDLFAGRLALADVLRLAPWFRSGYVRPPTYLPSWVEQRSQLASFLTYADFAHALPLGGLSLEKLADFARSAPGRMTSGNGPRLED